MAITKTNAIVKSVRVEGDVVTATVHYSLSNDSTSPATIEARVRVDALVVSNATSGELTALRSVISKAAVLASA